MNKRVTYFLGAGASANAIPIVSQFRARAEYFLRFIEGDSNLKTLIGKDGLYNKIKSSFRLSLEGIKNHSSPDTYAKKLYLQEDYIGLKKLKHFIMCFFCFEQSSLLQENHKNMFEQEVIKLINLGRDIRYDTFFATLLQKDSLKLPREVNIITWNYDNQLELAYGQYLKTQIEHEDNYSNIYGGLQVIPRKNLTQYNPDNSSLIHLNGEISLINLIDQNNITSKNQHEQFFSINIENNYSQIINYMNLFEFLLTWEPSIQFAWEKSMISKQRINIATQIMMQTDILVIVGYSFPTFNREIDKIIFAGSEPDKIYIQDIEATNRESIKEKYNRLIKKVADRKFDLRPDFDQFVIPFEI